jgi:hypothetical protein
MTRNPTCTSPSALCYAGAAFLVFYGIGLVAAQVWPSLYRFDETLVLASIGGACVMNYRRHCTVHCGITGPLFLVGAAGLALIEGGVWPVDTALVWALMCVGTGLAFMQEWRIAGMWKT